MPRLDGACGAQMGKGRVNRRKERARKTEREKYLQRLAPHPSNPRGQVIVKREEMGGTTLLRTSAGDGSNVAAPGTVRTEGDELGPLAGMNRAESVTPSGAAEIKNKEEGGRSAVGRLLALRIILRPRQGALATRMTISTRTQMEWCPSPRALRPRPARCKR